MINDILINRTLNMIGERARKPLMDGLNGPEINRVVDIVVTYLYEPCTKDPDLQPVAFGVSTTILAEVFGITLKVAGLLLETQLRLKEANLERRRSGERHNV